MVVIKNDVHEITLQKAAKGGEMDLICRIDGNKKSIVPHTDNSEKAVLIRKMYAEMTKRSSATRTITVEEKMANALPFLEQYFAVAVAPTTTACSVDTDTATDTTELHLPANAPTIIKKFVDFMTEFEVTVTFRMLNSISHLMNTRKGKKAAKEYLVNYLRLTDNPSASLAKDKFKSPEFEEILDSDLFKTKPDFKVNRRFKVFFGPAGGGKTTLAEKLTGGKGMLCSEDMDGIDLIRVVDVRDGVPCFVDSPLIEAVKNGDVVYLDEINHLNTNARSIIQQLTDGKKTFMHPITKELIKIHSDFQIIGTMNLDMDGMTFPLSQALVDRADELVEFIPTPTQLCGAWSENPIMDL